MRLRKRGDIWFARFWEGAARVERSTRCTDKKAAETVARQWERDAADPDHATTRRATLNDALALLLSDRREEARAGRKSERTVSFYEQKAGHLARVMGHDLLLKTLDLKTVKAYISQRRGEPAHAQKRPIVRGGKPVVFPLPSRVSDHTIAKELVCLRAALKLAVTEGLWKGDPRAVVPVAFSPEYEPRTRWLTRDELQRLMTKLDPDHSARVAFIVATSACWHETVVAKRSHVSADKSRVHIHGTKRKTRNRVVPIVTDFQRELLEYALDHAEGAGGMLFAEWPAAQQAIRWACKRAEIDPCTPNDLRRTFAQWMRAAGMPIEILAPMMGHASTMMLEKVYGRFNADTLAARARAAIDCPTGAPLIRVEAAIPAGSAAPQRVGQSAEIEGDMAEKSGGLCGERSHDLRIKSPSVLWPSPREKKPRVNRRARSAPPVPHVSTGSKKGGRS